ncbi:RNA polymerase sigma-I factor [Cohnella pontilimi]|nr:RNA polymerase sigma-I factor [Cohnella pontilimi]
MQGGTPEQRVEAIQAGDEAQREAFIVQYRPFITKTASRVCRRFIDPERDDEFSVALAAFNEAINRFTPNAGSSFIGFADTVISRRLIDYRRQEMRHAQSIPYSSFTDDEDNGQGYLNRMENAAAVEVYEQSREAEDRRAEIAALSERLADFGIRFTDLVDHSPRHRDSRLVLLRIGTRLGQTPELWQMLTEKRQLPVKELCIIEGVSRKTVERHRKYLIAVSLIAAGPYPCLRQYISLEYDKQEGTPS